MSGDTLRIHYHHNKSELCELGRKYDSDKSSQRENVSDYRHCHPYTLFYDALFRKKRHDAIHIAELGILEGGSLRMWQDYFTNATIHGFDFDLTLINRFKQKFNNDRIILSHIDVTNKDSIVNTFHECNMMYDMIIEDTTHQFEDQIRVIENIYSYLKPGGILIIEDIFKSYNEDHYITRLQQILHHFQEYYFVELDHYNRNSTGWNNDKLFILVKGGAEPIFKNTNKLTIITPSYRIDNLTKIYNSINFDYVDEWIIVYDGTKITEKFKFFNNEKIKEYVHTSNGISGNPQRNYALTTIKNPDTLLYYLDDDNIVHPSLYQLLNMIDPTKMYTFNQHNRIKGNNINVGNIDTAMMIIPYRLCHTLNWIVDKYDADGYYIKNCYDNNKNSHIFVDNELCYYNKLSL
jgi:predicted O-methyltransferase YrrM